MDFLPLLDGRFNSFAARDEEWIVLGFKHRNPMMSFKEIAYTLMVEGLAYLSPSSVYRILKKNDLITPPWNRKTWASTRPEHAKSPDERWQTMDKASRKHPLSVDQIRRKLRITKKLLPRERPYSVIKRVFNKGHVFVTMIRRVRVEVMFSYFCYDLFTIFSMKKKGNIAVDI